MAIGWLYVGVRRMGIIKKMGRGEEEVETWGARVCPLPIVSRRVSGSDDKT